jgi:hypothetical protein
VQDPNVLLTILGKMAQKPEVKFDKLFPKLYNIELWLMAYEQLAPKPGNMTLGSDGRTIDGMGLERITDTVSQLRASRYKPNPVRRVYIEKANKKLRPIGIPCFVKLHPLMYRSFTPMMIHPITLKMYHPFTTNLH